VCFNFIGKSQDFEKRKEKQSRSTKGGEGRRERWALHFALCIRQTPNQKPNIISRDWD
jgi:hypothetical protein